MKIQDYADMAQEGDFLGVSHFSSVMCADSPFLGIAPPPAGYETLQAHRV
jgi:hypothetical protein